MKHRYESLGFIGGGRIVRILLGGLSRKEMLPARVIVSDTSPDVLSALKAGFPGVGTSGADPKRPAAADLVFLALHPPAVMGVLGGIAPILGRNSVVVSLAPKLTIGQLSNGLGGFRRIVRMIPNAPSIVNKGFNPVAFDPAFDGEEKKAIRKYFETLGDCPEVEEGTLEAYAVLTAMGPTYLWFQLNELRMLGESFGLSPKQASRALNKMVKGAAKILFDSGMSPQEVMDLVPVKPIGEDEEAIRKIYRTKLEGLYAKLKV
ncbi:MAG: NAD(P)-binding domain-containing protein [Syntrophaceae bacterium]|nr:NAD(P)-binding domain-containing protein [Syntrophaceae bacterium]